MIKYFAFISFALITSVTFAQRNSTSKDKEISRISYVVKGGLNLSSMLLKSDEGKRNEGLNSKTGLHFGITAEYPVSERVALGTGILISSKGTKSSSENTYNGVIYKSNSIFNLLYLEIPLTAQTYFNVGQSKIYGALGPYIGFGIGGKYKGNGPYPGGTNSYGHDILWGSGTEDEFKRLDYGLTAGAGLEFRSFQIGLTYDLGFANISTFTDNGVNIKNRVLGLSIGYKFGRT
jgi:hypothetical protein